jgi:hypothetical protein
MYDSKCSNFLACLFGYDFLLEHMLVAFFFANEHMLVADSEVMTHLLVELWAEPLHSVQQKRPKRATLML